MNTNAAFVAQILETSASGLAGMSASLLLERGPEIAVRYEPGGFSSWKAQLKRCLIDLSTAVATGEPRLFEARVLWIRDAFVARQTPVGDLRAALLALRDILQERLPANSVEAAIPTVDRAIAAIAKPAIEPDVVDRAPDQPDKLALSYLHTILEGKPREALEQLLHEIDDGMSVREAYLRVLLPAQRETGRMWHAGELLIVEEHVITMTTRRAMTLLCERGRASVCENKTAVLACVAGNVHDIGICAISDFLEMAGWRAINLGPNVPDEEIARGVQLFDADAVLLAATLDPHLKEVQRAIEGVRALGGRDRKIIVGGPAFEAVPDLWRSLGADGYSARIEESEPLAARLTRS
jgi:methanogenic corrinoid protein MtbC1